MNHRILFPSLAVFLVVGHNLPPLRAQGRETPSRIAYIEPQTGLGVDELVALALKSSKRIEAAAEQVEAARGEALQAGLRPNPLLTARQREQAGGPDRQSVFELEWPLDLFRKPARAELGNRAVAMADAELVERQWELSSRVRKEAVQVLVAVRVLELAEEQVSAAATLLDLVGTSVEAGATPRLDRDISLVELRRLEAQVPVRRADVEGSLARLEALTGMSPTARLRLRSSLEAEAAGAVTATRAFQQNAAAPEARPDLTVLTSGVAVAQGQADVERQNGRFDVNLMGGYMRTATSFPQLAFGAGTRLEPVSARFHEVAFGATVTLPWRNRNQGAVAAATARERSAVADRDAAVLEARAEARAAKEKWIAITTAVDAYSSGLLTLARQNLEVVQQTYLAGRGTLNDVITERRRLLELEVTYAMLLGDQIVADAEYRRALGVIR